MAELADAQAAFGESREQEAGAHPAYSRLTLRLSD